ncbi:MAG: LytTR family DNA-binding domain-containing protein [Reichenbachiella sp.]|uniref:LytR/AlgR family response regulator transcription factor n=1 Tax=Reichenbachiella sp. TaxID=2184521 RepID=UPI0032656F2E
MKNKLRCLIVDDEPLAANVLEKYILRLDHLTLVGKSQNAVEAFNILNAQAIDLMFLDIKMPQITGLEFLRSLRRPPAVIFTTAYRDFALEGFEMSAVDYLLKPISFERFLKAISKIVDSSSGQSANESASDSLNTLDREYIFVREDKRMKKVLLTDILFIESIKDYVKIITKSGPVMTYLKMNYLEEQLPDQLFLRAHKSYIINIQAIQAYGATDIEIEGTVIPIGRHYKQAVHRRLDELML